MLVADDIGELAKRVLSRFPDTRDEVLEAMQSELAPWPIDLIDVAVDELRGTEPGNYKRLEKAKLASAVRRLAVQRNISPAKPNIEVKSPVVGIPFDLNQRPPDRRSPEQKRYDEQIRQSREWVETLDPDERKSLLEEALTHWPDGDERAMYRQSGVKLHLVRFEMIRASERREREASVMA